MKWLNDPDRVKVHWRLIGLNVAAALFNFWLIVWLWTPTTIANLISGSFSLWVAWGFYRKIPTVKREQEQRILDYLKGSKA